MLWGSCEFSCCFTTISITFWFIWFECMTSCWTEKFEHMQTVEKKETIAPFVTFTTVRVFSMCVMCIACVCVCVCVSHSEFYCFHFDHKNAERVNHWAPASIGYDFDLAFCIQKISISTQYYVAIVVYQSYWGYQRTWI